MDPFPPQKPPPKQPDPTDPAWREIAARGAVKVVEITATLAAVARFIPGPAGKLFAFLAAGVEKDPGTGKVRPGRGTLGNFLPAPVGFNPPAVWGFKPNWWLPSGATNYVPRIADNLGLGLPEQRTEDEWKKALANASRLESAFRLVENERFDVVKDLAEGTGGTFSIASQIRAGSKIGFDELQLAARFELARRERNGGVFSNTLTPFLAPAPTTTTTTSPDPTAGPFTGAVLVGSIQPEFIEPVNDAAKRNGDNASGIAAALVHERADP